MPTVSGEQQRQASGVLLRGGLFVVIAIVAVRWPETFFLDALIGVCAVSLVFGLHESLVSRTLHHLEYRLWWLSLLNALTLFVFGATTLTMLFAPLDVAIVVIVAWFACYGVCLGIGASALRDKPVVERVLVALGLIHAAISGMVLVMPVYPRLSILALPAVGALYAALFGTWQIVMAAWLLKHASRELGSSPTIAMNGAGILRTTRVS